MKVLIAGLNNYLARTIALCLSETDYEVTCLIRNKKFFSRSLAEQQRINLIEGDLYRGALPQGLDKRTRVAIYFNQSPVGEIDIRLEMDLIALQKFVRAIKSTACEHLIYVTKLADENVDKIKEFLERSGLDYTILRISNVIGKGSALMNVFSNLAMRKVVVFPKEFTTSKFQPVHISDANAYIKNILLDSNAYGKVFDVGGPEVLTYRDAFECYLHIANLKKKIVAFPILSKSLSLFLGRYIYRFEQDVATALITYMHKDLLVVNNGLGTLYPAVELAHFGSSISDALEMPHIATKKR